MASLVDQWLDGEQGARTIDEASVSELRVRMRAQAAFGGEAFAESCAIIASELAHNQLRHAGEGVTAVRALERDGVRGLEIVAADTGPGIASDVFFGTRPVSTQSLGAGLGAVQRLSHEVDFDVRVHEGTCVRARKFAGNVVPRREVGIAGRPIPGARISGDQSLIRRTDERLIACVVDGVGHGEAAREASDRAIESFGAAIELPPAEIVTTLDQALKGRRGAVLSRVVVDERLMTLEHFGVGNVTSILAGPASSQRFVSINGIVGQSVRTRRRMSETAALQPGQMIIMHSDGLTSGTGLHDRPDLFHRPAIAVAMYLLETFARPRDDAIVVVIR